MKFKIGIVLIVLAVILSHGSGINAKTIDCVIEHINGAGNETHNMMILKCEESVEFSIGDEVKVKPKKNNIAVEGC